VYAERKNGRESVFRIRELKRTLVAADGRLKFRRFSLWSMHRCLITRAV
jgi:hypothetical protein